MVEKKTVFFRNDDVGLRPTRGVEPELEAMNSLFMEEQVPICHAVVPGNVDMETVKWLLERKSRHPDLLSIGQHGYRHARLGRGGEFRGRSYREQLRDIEAGLELMREYFGPGFSPWFAPPWIKYDGNTKAICGSLGFRAFSGGASPRMRARIFNALGRGLGVSRIGPKEVSYHMQRSFAQPGRGIIEVSVSVDVVEDYSLRRVKPLEEILRRFRKCRRHYDVVGVMLHHWVFDSPEKLGVIRALLHELKAGPGSRFLLIDDVEALCIKR